MIVGTLDRVGIFEGQSDDGERYKQLEVDLGTKEGRVSVKAAISLNPQSSNVSAFQFAQGLLAVRKGDLIAIKPQRSKTAHEKYGTYTTFVNVGLVDPGTMKAKAVQVDKSNFEGSSSKEKLGPALDQIKAHSAYADRPKRDDDDDSGSGEDFSGMFLFGTKAEAKGWPALNVAGAVYLEMCGKLAGKTFSSLSEVQDDIWTKMQEGLEKAKTMPAALAKIAAELEKDDPFA